MLRGNRDGVVQIPGIDQIISPEEFAGLGEWVRPTIVVRCPLFKFISGKVLSVAMNRDFRLWFFAMGLRAKLLSPRMRQN